MDGIPPVLRSRDTQNAPGPADALDHAGPGPALGARERPATFTGTATRLPNGEWRLTGIRLKQKVW
jgi:hypothetical protein